jgi:NTE family protein
MPFGTEGVEKGIGLALSGGGFRATLFHIGALWRLNELGILGRIDRFSSISGGSIVAGLLAKEWHSLEIVDGTSTRFDELIVAPLRDFCRQPIDTHAIGEGLLIPWKTVSGSVQERYDKHLFGNITLQQIPDTPRFVFNTTNLQTGKSFRFSKPYMGDYLLGLIEKPDLPLSLAVAASSAFPPVLSPVLLENLPPFRQVDGATLWNNPEFSKTLYLSDGGVYDNLGLETVWNRYTIVLVSDAGAPFKVAEKVQTDWLSQSRTALDVATEQSRALRKRALITDFLAKKRQGAYWGIDTDIRAYPIGDPMRCREGLVSVLAQMRTRLNPFSDQEQGSLINWGYALCDAAVRSHIAALAPAAKRPNAWPCPDQALGTLQ